MRALAVAGLNTGTAGNASVRLDRGFLITPTALAARDLSAERMVWLDANGQPAPDAEWRPSSEWRIHRDVYAARPDAGALVHAHSPYATALACARMEIPAFHYMIAVAGGDSIRCADYATFGTQALSDRALRALEDRRACLLANHGLLALGSTLAAASALALEVETLARQYCLCRQVGGPVLLDAEEMAAVAARFEDYGQQAH